MFDWWMWLIIGVTLGVALQKNWRSWWRALKDISIPAFIVTLMVAQIFAMVGLFVFSYLEMALATHTCFGLLIGCLGVDVYLMSERVQNVVDRVIDKILRRRNL